LRRKIEGLEERESAREARSSVEIRQLVVDGESLLSIKPA
jgi:hypothetical protein